MAEVYIRDLDAVTAEVLTKCGVDAQSIGIILDTMHYANRRGMATHGVGRLPLYVKKIQAGYFAPGDEVETVLDTGAAAVLDAHNGFGQVAAYHAVSQGIEKARKFGVAAIGVRSSNNFGMAGYFGDMAARSNMAALIFANAAPAIAPTGGHKTIFGTNPICFAFPGAKQQRPVVLDMATTVAARGKIRLAAKNGERIPMDWAVGPDGQPTDDPEEALKGSLLPIGGYKGYGLALFVDLFAGLLTGSPYAGNIRPLSDLSGASNNGHLFILMDVRKFMTEAELEERIESFCRAVKACGDEGKVLLPGERGYRMMDTQREAVTLPQKQLQEINELAEEFGCRTKVEEIGNE